jgi:hypothetical protein
LAKSKASKRKPAAAEAAPAVNTASPDTAAAPEPAKKPKAKASKPAAPKKKGRGKYDPKLCAKIEALGAEGKSAPEIRRELGIPRSTWSLWVKTHADFAEAVDEADDAAQAWWINLGRLGVRMGTNFNATAFVYITKNIFPARFRDRQDHTVSGPNDGPIVQELRVPDLASIADPRQALKEFQSFRASLALTAPAPTKH